MICDNDIFKVLKFSCSDRDRFQGKNTLIASAVGSLKVYLTGFMLALHSHTPLVLAEQSSWWESLL